MYKTWDRDYGYNISFLSNCPMGKRKHSEETKLKLSEIRKGKNYPMYGRHHSKETKLKLSISNGGDKNLGKNNPFYGRHHNESTKKKISEANTGRAVSSELKKYYSEKYKGKGNPFYGKKHSEEVRRKISEGRRGKLAGKNNPNAKAIVKLGINGEFICVYDTVTEAAKDTKAQRSHIALVCRGERNKSGGFKWLYYEEYIKSNKII